MAGDNLSDSTGLLYPQQAARRPQGRLLRDIWTWRNMASAILAANKLRPLAASSLVHAHLGRHTPAFQFKDNNVDC